MAGAPRPGPALVALHRHWLLADAVQYHGRRSLKLAAEEGLPPELALVAKAASGFGMIQVWYGLLFVVIEGYRELRLTDQAVDALLAEEIYVEALRRLRNATFHYQQDPFTSKLWDYLFAPESETWIRRLNHAFREFFERSLGIAEVIASLQEPPSSP